MHHQNIFFWFKNSSKNGRFKNDLQNKKIAEQERIEKERKISELNKELGLAYEMLEKSKSELNKTSGFKLLRSASERDTQIRLAQENISIYENEIEVIEKQINKLKTN